MKLHRLSDLLSDLYRRINPAYGPGRQKGEFVEALAAVGICPEHGNRGEEMETMVLVSEQELNKIRSDLDLSRRIEVCPELHGQLLMQGFGGSIIVCGEFSTGEEFRAKYLIRPSPAPVVGGVPDITDEEIDARLFYPGGPDSDEDWVRFMRKQCRWAYSLACSRLSSIKPGEWQELRELERLCRVFSDWSKLSAERACAETEVDNCLDRLEALRAQATPTEKEPDHA